ncbi:MAG: molybdopterin-dependent oxidoreductase [Adlercreutzia equolifaciens]
MQECINCHHWAPGGEEHEFGTLMHAVHFGARHKVQFAEEYGGNCNSCHNATDNARAWRCGPGEVRSSGGVNNIASEDLGDVDFSFEQETTQDNAFRSSDARLLRPDAPRCRCAGNQSAPEPVRQLGDHHRRSGQGPYTATLKELVDEAEKAGVVVEKTSKIVCSWNMVGGGGISNVKITGIPVSWLVEKAGGITDGANGVRAMRADGSSRRSFSLDKLNANEALLVYKINGEPLGAKQGYPCTNWVEGVDAQVFSKQINAYTVADDCPPDFGDSKYCAENYDGSPNGWFDENGVIVNRPNATILDVPEGLVIESGKPFDFHGYVDAYNEHISQMEFSFDGGDVDGLRSGRHRPESRGVVASAVDAARAGCLSADCARNDGRRQREQADPYGARECQDVLPSKEDTVVLETTSLVPARCGGRRPELEGTIAMKRSQKIASSAMGALLLASGRWPVFERH